MPTEELVAAEGWLERARSLKEEGWAFIDLTAVDLVHSGAREATDETEERFLVVLQFLHHARKERLMVHIPAPGEEPKVPSITSLYPGAAFFEREAYDLMGIGFDGHEGLSRIMMPDEWEGHPLRKDYGVGKVKVEFIEQPLLQIQTPGQSSTPDEAGQEVDRLGQAAGFDRVRSGLRWRPAAERDRGA
jgi:NADH-quinone oxidoreductase subunit C